MVYITDNTVFEILNQALNEPDVSRHNREQLINLLGHCRTWMCDVVRKAATSSVVRCHQGERSRGVPGCGQ